MKCATISGLSDDVMCLAAEKEESSLINGKIKGNKYMNIL